MLCHCFQSPLINWTIPYWHQHTPLGTQIALDHPILFALKCNLFRNHSLVLLLCQQEVLVNLHKFKGNAKHIWFT